MGDYSALISSTSFTVRMTEEEFMKKWDEACEADRNGTGLDDGYLDIYDWEFEPSKNPDEEITLTATLAMDDTVAKHYSTAKLAKFISEVIAENESCAVEFDGMYGRWGFFIKKDVVKEIDYVRMVDGVPIDKL